MDEALGQPHHEQVVLVLGVILGKLPQHGASLKRGYTVIE